jgi:hypothetical protein
VRALSAQAEYVATPNYPPIVDTPPDILQKDAWHARITNLPTFEQKLVEYNMPKAYGYWSCILKDHEYQVNGTAFLKFVTRTKIMDGPKRDYYNEVAEAAANAAVRLAPDVERLILLHHHQHVFRDEDSEVTRKESQANFIHGLHRLLSSCLPVPSQARVTQEPRVVAGWFAGGLDNVGADRREWMHLSKETREKKLWVRNLFLDREEPFMGDRVIRSSCNPLLVVRERYALPPVVDRLFDPTAEDNNGQNADEHLDTSAGMGKVTRTDDDGAPPPPVDDGRCDPETYGYLMAHAPLVLNPGEWRAPRAQPW